MLLDEQTSTINSHEAWIGKAILLLDLDAFFASVEQLDHPLWRGKPVIVGGDPQRRGIVSTASYEARAYGVHSAMPASVAQRLCPDAFWCRGRFSRYKELSSTVMGFMLDISPFIQQVSIDEAFLDITPTPHQQIDPAKLAKELQERVAQLGITCSIGIGVSKSVAKVASEEAKPNGITIIYPGTEQRYLAPLPLSRMSGIGPSAQEKLEHLNIRTLGEVAQADSSVLKHIFGKRAEAMRDRCLGKDSDPVIKRSHAQSISSEQSFAQDIFTSNDVENAIKAAASKVARRLRASHKLGNTVTLKVRYADRSIKTAQKRLSQPTDLEIDLRPTLIDLLHTLWRERQPIRLIGVAVSDFGNNSLRQEQMALFDEKHPSEDKQICHDRNEKIEHVTDLVKNRFGEQAVRFGREIKTSEQTTGTAPKNPADYQRD
ncbi:MAG: DNA polymerase IV [Eggerthellaceae bacterium]|jgi:DNA polymerase-4|nr:DNA polymerase IV [Eggerthellaceae bacterium]MCH4220576.1 DNA polymerase IV [Eggerthellaceae bacterium]